VIPHTRRHLHSCSIPPLATILLLPWAPALFAQTVALSSGTAGSNGTVTLNLNLTSPSGSQPAALQWTLTFSPSAVVAISAAAGTAATNANKTLTCAAASGSYTCLISGMNANLIANGIVAAINVTIAAGAGNTSLAITNTLAASASGGNLTLSGTGGTITGSGSGTTPPPPSTSTLNTSLWTFLNPAGGSYSLNGSDLFLTAPGGSNHDPSFGGSNNAVGIMQPIGNADFTVEVKFDSIPTLQYQFEGVIVKQDAANYLRFQFGSTGGLLLVGASSILSHAESSLFSSPINLPNGANSLWMRIIKSGNSWTQTWSTDGRTYNTAGSFTHALSLTGIGPFVGNYNNTPSLAPTFTAAIDYFINTTPSAAGASTTDSFTGNLNTSLWTFLNPAGGTYSLNGSELLLRAPGGSNHDPAFGGSNNAVGIMQPIANTDFTAELKFDSVPTLQYQFQGAIVKQDAANYLRIQFGSTGSQLIANTSAILNHIETELIGGPISIPPGTTSLWMRVQKAGTTWTQLWSTDGSNYHTVGTFPLTLAANSIGPFVGNYNTLPSSAPAFTGVLDYFSTTTPSATASPVSDNFN